eukprot:TRINITY_DN81422_c0_g1_i1.p1 TRINITY_DN81422_c0_g1~~TRINITY_DN81422_c0_g1_i1.p1  ORF type:complete len:550 (-),score=103.31 TRINITY_DN81422_c0_g1_i1:44-1693(-)
MKRPAAAPAAAAPKRKLTKHARSVSDKPAEKISLAGGDGLLELRQNHAKVEQELREAEAEQTSQKAKLKQAERDAKDAREALARLDSVVMEKRSAFTELTQQVSAAVRAKGVTKVSMPLGPPVSFKSADIRFHEEDAGGDLECNILVTVQAECYQVVTSGKSAKVIRYERGCEASELKPDIPTTPEEPKHPKGPKGAYFLWLDDNRDALAKEAGTGNINQLASQRWGALGEHAQQPYFDKAAQERAAHRAAMEEFVKAGGVKSSGKKLGRKEKKRPQISDFIVSCNHLHDEGDANGTVVCTTMAGREVGQFAVPPGEAALGMWLPGTVLQSVSVPKNCRLRLVNLQGDVFWTQADDAVRPLLSNVQQLDRLKKQHDKDGHIVAATEQAATKTLLQALNFGDDACLGHILMGSHFYDNLSSPIPSNSFLKEYLKPIHEGPYGDYDALLILKAKLVRGLGLDKSISNFLLRQVQRGCQMITVRYIGDKRKLQRAKVSGRSQRRMLISGCNPLDGRAGTAHLMEEVMVIDVDFDFDGRMRCDGMGDSDGFDE